MGQSKQAGSRLRQRMMTDMDLAGLAARTQQNYIGAVRSLAAHYMRSPDRISEEEVRTYLLALRDRGAARGTFKIAYHGIKFLYSQTLNCDWPLFVKKRFASPSRNGCPLPCPIARSASF
jgi:hypothetical protein